MNTTPTTGVVVNTPSITPTLVSADRHYGGAREPHHKQKNKGKDAVGDTNNNNNNGVYNTWWFWTLIAIAAAIVVIAIILAIIYSTGPKKSSNVQSLLAQ